MDTTQAQHLALAETLNARARAHDLRGNTQAGREYRQLAEDHIDAASTTALPVSDSDIVEVL